MDDRKYATPQEIALQELRLSLSALAQAARFLFRFFDRAKTAPNSIGAVSWLRAYKGALHLYSAQCKQMINRIGLDSADVLAEVLRVGVKRVVDLENQLCADRFAISDLAPWASALEAMTDPHGVYGPTSQISLHMTDRAELLAQLLPAIQRLDQHNSTQGLYCQVTTCTVYPESALRWN